MPDLPLELATTGPSPYGIQQLVKYAKLQALDALWGMSQTRKTKTVKPPQSVWPRKPVKAGTTPWHTHERGALKHSPKKAVLVIMHEIASTGKPNDTRCS
jgi:hypothetical protein